MSDDTTTNIRQWGTSLVILLPDDFIKDSTFPFKLEKETKEGREIYVTKPVRIKIDEDKKRLIIQEV